jgi:hypothetical protein
MVVIILIASATYFAVIFFKLDSATVATMTDPSIALPWLECLNQVAKSLILGEPAVVAVLYFIARMGLHSRSAAEHSWLGMSFI